MAGNMLGIAAAQALARFPVALLSVDDEAAAAPGER
jgi:hypothetical protein